MTRRVYIIPQGADVNQYRERAENNNCPEICVGIPALYRNLYSDLGLPVAHEEPALPPIAAKETIDEKLEKLNARIATLEDKKGGA